MDFKDDSEREQKHPATTTSASSYLLTLPSDLLLLPLQWLSCEELLIIGQVNHILHVLSCDDSLWSFLASHAWCGRFQPELWLHLIPTLQTEGSYADSRCTCHAWGKADMEREATERQRRDDDELKGIMSDVTTTPSDPSDEKSGDISCACPIHGTSLSPMDLSWKERYVCSVVDARRSYLHMDELCSIRWRFHFDSDLFLPNSDAMYPRFLPTFVFYGFTNTMKWRWIDEHKAREREMDQDTSNKLSKRFAMYGGTQEEEKKREDRPSSLLRRGLSSIMSSIGKLTSSNSSTSATSSSTSPSLSPSSSSSSSPSSATSSAHPTSSSSSSISPPPYQSPALVAALSISTNTVQYPLGYAYGTSVDPLTRLDTRYHRRVQVAYYPHLRASRQTNGGWYLKNQFVTFTSVHPNDKDWAIADQVHTVVHRYLGTYQRYFVSPHALPAPPMSDAEIRAAAYNEERAQRMSRVRRRRRAPSDEETSEDSDEGSAVGAARARRRRRRRRRAQDEYDSDYEEEQSSSEDDTDSPEEEDEDEDESQVDLNSYLISLISRRSQHQQHPHDRMAVTLFRAIAAQAILAQQQRELEDPEHQREHQHTSQHQHSTTTQNRREEQSEEVPTTFSSSSEEGSDAEGDVPIHPHTSHHH